MGKQEGAKEFLPVIWKVCSALYSNLNFKLPGSIIVFYPYPGPSVYGHEVTCS